MIISSSKCTYKNWVSFITNQTRMTAVTLNHTLTHDAPAGANVYDARI